MNIPRMDPRVLRRLENCSATETIAIVLVISKYSGRTGLGWCGTEEARMGGHVCTFQHLCHTTKCSDQALNDLKCCLRALTEAIRQAVGIVWVPSHHSWLSHTSSVHAPVAPHASIHGAIPTAVSSHSAVHGVTHTAEARIWR